MCMSERGNRTCRLFKNAHDLLYSQAAGENKNDNYEEARRLHKKAQWFNAAGFIFIVVGGIMFLVFIPIAAAVGGTIAAVTL